MPYFLSIDKLTQAAVTSLEKKPLNFGTAEAYRDELKNRIVFLIDLIKYEQLSHVSDRETFSFGVGFPITERPDRVLSNYQLMTNPDFNQQERVRKTIKARSDEYLEMQESRGRLVDEQAALSQTLNKEETLLNNEKKEASQIKKKSRDVFFKEFKKVEDRRKRYMNSCEELTRLNHERRRVPVEKQDLIDSKIKKLQETLSEEWNDIQAQNDERYKLHSRKIMIGKLLIYLAPYRKQFDSNQKEVNELCQSINLYDNYLGWLSRLLYILEYRDRLLQGDQEVVEMGDEFLAEYDRRMKEVDLSVNAPALHEGRGHTFSPILLTRT